MLKWFWRVLLVLMASAACLAGYAYWKAFLPNVVASKEGDFALKIPRGAGFDYVMEELEASKALKDVGSFATVARFRGYPTLVKPGLYLLKPGLNNWELVGKLRSGAQDQMKLSYRSHRSLDEIADDIGPQMEFGKDALISKMRDAAYLKKYGFDERTIRALFVPDTYFVYWTMSLDEFFSKMKREYDAFWNADRKAKAAASDMSPTEAITLASIVQSETYMATERPVVAGLYLNRLRDGIPLQADPTVIFAHQDWSIRRVLTRHLEIDSPYNTYKYAGLPPGPINNPERSAIEAVLSPASHKYIFMCAKPDFSGYHNFASTLSQHNRNAAAYQAAMNKQKVYK